MGVSIAIMSGARIDALDRQAVHFQKVGFGDSVSAELDKFSQVLHNVALI